MSKVKITQVILLLVMFSTQLSAQNWPQLDAVVYNNISDKYYFFYGKYCVIKERGKYIDGLPLLITEEWEGFPKSWKGGNIDAACFVSDVVQIPNLSSGAASPKGTYYFFKGDEVCAKVMGENIGKPIKLNDAKGFPGLPWPKVDAVVFNSVTQTYYFFNGDEYTSKKKGEPVVKVAKKLSDGWANLPAERPIRDVTYSSDNKAYYFFWNDYYITKEQGQDIKPNSQRTYQGDGQKGFEWAERSNDNFVGVSNESGYFTSFKVTWKNNGKSDSWSKDGTALSYEKRLKLPKEATDVVVEAYVWDVVKQKRDKLIMSESYPTIPPNRWFKVYGTVFKPEYKIEKKSTNLLGSIETFFTKDIANKFNGALSDLNDAMTDAQYAIVKELAKSDAQKYMTVINKLGVAANQIVRDQNFIDGLFRASKDKSAERNGDFVKQLAARPEVADIIKTPNFKTISVGFTAGASAVIGIEGAFGYGVSFDGTKVKGFAGLDGSMGVQSGVGAGCQFGIWTSQPNNLDGPSVGVSVEVGSGFGVAFSISYNVSFENDIPKFSFAGITVTPSVGAGMGASVSSGYSWVY